MEVPRYWRLRRQRLTLAGSVCPECGQKAFPPEIICRSCGADNRKGKGEQKQYAVELPKRLPAELPRVR